jgi:hypothetical protein
MTKAQGRCRVHWDWGGRVSKNSGPLAPAVAAAAGGWSGGRPALAGAVRRAWMDADAPQPHLLGGRAVWACQSVIGH